MRNKRPPIANFTDEYFGCMTIPIALFAAGVAVYLMFAGAIKRHWSAFARFWWGY
jgi:hypothetical protein